MNVQHLLMCVCVSKSQIIAISCIGDLTVCGSYNNSTLQTPDIASTPSDMYLSLVNVFMYVYTYIYIYVYIYVYIYIYPPAPL